MQERQSAVAMIGLKPVVCVIFYFFFARPPACKAQPPTTRLDGFHFLSCVSWRFIFFVQTVFGVSSGVETGQYPNNWRRLFVLVGALYSGRGGKFWGGVLVGKVMS